MMFAALEINWDVWQTLPGRTLETLGQTLLASLVVLLIGLPIGVLVHVTEPGGLRPQVVVHRITTFIVNVGRSVPFIVLMFLLIPVTRWIAGTSIGWRALSIPLAIGCIPFFARIAENALRGVGKGKVEAALMVGASRLQVITGVLLRESLPGLVGGITVTEVTLIGYSAITGAVGGGGLGSLAYNYGYSRYMFDVMIIVTVVFFVIVQVVQMAGDLAARRLDHTR
ncbi:MAG: ABC transporter permease [Bifidobacteriaceae bacterium]|jgi:D-methionine transport system permease protein|nr:ABC transporter permease [Bifidobacteriaceae bacterium]